jgi:hypothetical protein
MFSQFSKKKFSSLQMNQKESQRENLESRKRMHIIMKWKLDNECDTVHSQVKDPNCQ